MTGIPNDPAAWLMSPGGARPKGDLAKSGDAAAFLEAVNAAETPVEAVDLSIIGEVTAVESLVELSENADLNTSTDIDTLGGASGQLPEIESVSEALFGDDVSSSVDLAGDTDQVMVTTDAAPSPQPDLAQPSVIPVPERPAASPTAISDPTVATRTTEVAAPPVSAAVNAPSAIGNTPSLVSSEIRSPTEMAIRKQVEPPRTRETGTKAPPTLPLTKIQTGMPTADQGTLVDGEARIGIHAGRNHPGIPHQTNAAHAPAPVTQAAASEIAPQGFQAPLGETEGQPAKTLAVSPETTLDAVDAAQFRAATRADSGVASDRVSIDISDLKAGIDRQVRALAERASIETAPTDRPGQSKRTEIDLAPAELGRLKITLHTGERGLQLQIAVERPETLEIVRRHLDGLHRDLIAGGLSLDSFELESNLSQQGETMQDDPAPDDTQDAFSPTIGNDDTIPTPQRPAVTPGRLDIRL